jgi:hypothetical protein
LILPVSLILLSIPAVNSILNGLAFPNTCLWEPPFCKYCIILTFYLTLSTNYPVYLKVLACLTFTLPDHAFIVFACPSLSWPSLAWPNLF